MLYHCIDTAGKKKAKCSGNNTTRQEVFGKKKGFILKYTFPPRFVIDVHLTRRYETNKRRKPHSVQSSKMSREYLQDELYAWVWVGEGADPAVRTL